MTLLKKLWRYAVAQSKYEVLLLKMKDVKNNHVNSHSHELTARAERSSTASTSVNVQSFICQNQSY